MRGVDDQGHRELHRVLHALADQGGDRVDLVFRDLEDEFVVDLEEHLRARRLGRKAPMEVEHRELDQVRGGALDDGVDRHALAERLFVRVARVDLRDRAATTEDRFDVAVGVALRLIDAGGEELVDPGEARLVVLDDLRGF